MQKRQLNQCSPSKIPEFWSKLKSVKDGNDQPKFGLLSQLMCGLLALLHSSACVERVFSQLNLVKTKQTNRLKTRTVANRLLAKQDISRQRANCSLWVPPKTVIEDVKQGRCHRRNTEYLQMLKQEKTMSIQAVDAGCESFEEHKLMQTFLQTQ